MDKGEQNIEKLLIKLAKRGGPEEWNALGVRYSNGAGVEQDLKKAAKWFFQAAYGESTQGKYNLALCYSVGDGVRRSARKAAKWYKEAARCWHTPSLYALSKCYDRGTGVKANEDKAEHYRNLAKESEKLAAVKGAAPAVDDYKIFIQKPSSADPDDTKIENGDPVAARASEPAPKGPEMGFKFYQTSAEQGDADAQYCLGVCYKRGSGTTRNMKKALEWFARSADQGNGNAQCALGVCYKEGDGVKKDPAIAAQFFLAAAQSGHATGQYNYALCCQQGAGVARDLSVAMEWFSVAAKQGHMGAQQAVKKNIL